MSECGPESSQIRADAGIQPQGRIGGTDAGHRGGHRCQLPHRARDIDDRKIVATRDLLGEVVANGVMNDASLPSRRPPIQTHEVHLRQVEVMQDETVCGGGRRPGERHSTALASNGSASQEQMLLGLVAFLVRSAECVGALTDAYQFTALDGGG